MIGPRICFGLWIILLVLLYIFTNSLGVIAVAVISMVMPIIWLCINKAAAKCLDISYSFPEVGEKNQDISGCIMVKNTSFLPVIFMEGSFYLKNLLTQEESRQKLCFSIGPKQMIKLPVNIISTHCGQIQIQLHELRLYDMFLLTFIKVPGSFASSITVVPKLFSPNVVLSLEAGARDGEEYAADRPGLDLSEVFSIRQYVPGDSLKSIHWRLSSKLDCLMVKEGSLPMGDSVLVLMENSIPQGHNMPSADGCDMMAEALISISYALSRAGIRHTIGWTDEKEEGIMQFQVETEEDIPEVTGKLLSMVYKISESSSLSTYLKASQEMQFSHVIYISSYIAEEVEALRECCHVTALLYSENGKDSIDEDNVIVFNENTLEDSLCNIQL